MPPPPLKEWSSRIRAGAQSLGLNLDDEPTVQLTRYVAVLIEWSRSIRLVSTNDPFVLIDRHIVDSLAPFAFLKSKGLDHRIQTVADLGSGGGLPGIPLKIAAPWWRMTLIESNQKKGIFLREAIKRLGLEEIVVANERVGPKTVPAALSEKFDCVATRATLAIEPFRATATKLLRPRGMAIAMVSLAQARRFKNQSDLWPYILTGGEAMSLITFS